MRIPRALGGRLACRSGIFLAGLWECGFFWEDILNLVLTDSWAAQSMRLFFSSSDYGSCRTCSMRWSEIGEHVYSRRESHSTHHARQDKHTWRTLHYQRRTLHSRCRTAGKVAAGRFMGATLRCAHDSHSLFLYCRQLSGRSPATIRVQASNQ